MLEHQGIRKGSETLSINKYDLKLKNFLDLNRDRKELKELLDYINNSDLDLEKLESFLVTINRYGPVNVGKITKELGYKQTINYKHIQRLRNSFLLSTNDEKGLIYMDLTIEGYRFLEHLVEVLGGDLSE